MSVATLAEIYVAAALRVKTSLPRALHFLTVSGWWAGGGRTGDLSLQLFPVAPWARGCPRGGSGFQMVSRPSWAQPSVWSGFGVPVWVPCDSPAPFPHSASS